MIQYARKIKVIKHRRKPSDGQSPSDQSEEKKNNSSKDTAPQDTDSELGRDRNSNKSQLDKQPNKGTLILDATVAPLHIAYPTDAGLLNHAR